MIFGRVPALLLSAVLLAFPAAAASPAKLGARNVVVFIADGLRYDSITQQNAPTLWRIRHEGVDFVNSHSIYPTLTTANASAIATGHYLGDTGDYANTLYVGFPVACRLGATVTFLEDDCILHEMKQHFGDDYLGPQSLLSAGRAAGMSTAVLGKLGPASIQDIGVSMGEGGILIDDATNRPKMPDGSPTGSVALPPDVDKDLIAALGSDQTPLPATPTTLPNVVQQKFLSAAAANVIIPKFKKQGKPFVLYFWSRDPDASQHAQSDSAGALAPGINGPTSNAAIANADANLKTIVDALKAQGFADNTDIFVTADHGFSTIAKSVPGLDGMLTPAHLPQGFVAIDVANWLGEKIFDPDASNAELILANGDHPSRGDGLVGQDPNNPDAVVAANGGSDFVYFLGPDARAHAKHVFDGLIAEDFVGALFVNDDFLVGGTASDFAGALPLSDIGLVGASHVPQPSIVISFRSFPVKGCRREMIQAPANTRTPNLPPLLCAAEIADTGLTVGQGMHGTFSRADTRNFMAAIGPDFKAHFVDTAPVGNFDIAPTLARILGLKPKAIGHLSGRIALEALKGGKMPVVSRKTLSATPGAGGMKTILNEQIVGSTRYFDAAGFPGRVVGLKAP